MKSNHSHHVAYAVILLMLGVIVGYGVGAAHENANQSEDQSVMSFFFGPKKKTTTVLPTVTTTPTTSSSTTSTITDKSAIAPSDWQTYTDSKYNFTIRYPKRLTGDTADWEYRANFSGVGPGFGPSNIKEDVSWGVFIYNKSEKTVDARIAEFGSQYTDRKVVKSNITINSKAAILVTTTTASHPGWILKDVIIETDSYFYDIDNGAVDIAAFDTFYGSFKLN